MRPLTSLIFLIKCYKEAGGPKTTVIISYGKSVTYIDGSRDVVRVNWSLVTSVKRQAQSDGNTGETGDIYSQGFWIL